MRSATRVIRHLISAYRSNKTVWRVSSSVRARRATNAEHKSAASLFTSLKVFNVAVTDQIVLPSATYRERLRSVDVLGSAPTTAALNLFTDTGTLGHFGLLYSAADEGVFPRPLRTWLSSGADLSLAAGAISGSTNTLDADLVFLVPASLLASGTYSLVAFMRRTAGATTRTIGWSARVVDDVGADVFGSELETSGSVDLTMSGTGWKPFTLASLTLPPVRLDNGDGYAVEIKIDVAGADLEVDECFLMDTDRGAYTIWDLPTDSGVSWVEVRSPELDAPLPAVYAGTGGSALDAARASAVTSSRSGFTASCAARC